VPRAILASLVVAAVIACAPPNRTQKRGVVVGTGREVITSFGCPSQRPSSWPHSQFRVYLGQSDTALNAETGALIIEVRVDSIPGPSSAQVSLRNQTTRRDVTYGDSVIRVNVPAGRYFLRARRIGAETLQDSIDVRSGFADTVRVSLGREMMCLVDNVVE
jgi:hypothetical protein